MGKIKVKTKIVLFDMNNLKIERDEFFNINKELSELGLHKKMLFNKGISVVGLDYVIDDETKFIKYLLHDLFRGYEIIDTQGVKGGHPDYILRKDKKEIFLELKINEDGLRTSQLRWFCNNRDKKLKILSIHYDPRIGCFL